MSRSERLFRLMHALRTLPQPVTAERLAQETGVSTRSLYRDIDSLRSTGVLIEGSRGIGYHLVEDGTLPPRAFDRLEIEALVLGMAEVRQIGDRDLAKAAESVLAKVLATLPSVGQQRLAHAVSKVHRFQKRYPPSAHLGTLREACWEEAELSINYRDEAGRATRRAVHPLAIVYVDHALVLLAFCCLRQGFRKFRVDRIASADATGGSFRPRRASLLRACLAELAEEGKTSRA